MAHLTVEFFSYTLWKCMSMDVILPQHSGRVSADDVQSYPVLYLLHGKSDNHSMWCRQTSVERYATEKGIAVVMPNADLSFYTDMRTGGKYWTFISEELPEVCRQFFPRISARREDTFAAGLSMGGYGAMKLGLRCPERFVAVASLSGCLDINAVIHRKEIADAAFWNGIFGSAEELMGSRDDLLALAEKIGRTNNQPAFFACCGTEDFLHEDNLRAVAKMKELGLNLTYEEGPGEHSWAFWDQWIKRILDWLPICR